MIDRRGRGHTIDTMSSEGRGPALNVATYTHALDGAHVPAADVLNEIMTMEHLHHIRDLANVPSTDVVIEISQIEHSLRRPGAQAQAHHTAYSGLANASVRPQLP